VLRLASGVALAPRVLPSGRPPALTEGPTHVVARSPDRATGSDRRSPRLCRGGDLRSRTVAGSGDPPQRGGERGRVSAPREALGAL